jgi:hypothetical protein
MSKYPWERAPEWAQYAASDIDGWSKWHEYEPTLDQYRVYWSQAGRSDFIPDWGIAPHSEEYETRPEA